MQNNDFSKESLEELEDFLCHWVYDNGTPFTIITYGVDYGLKIVNDDVAEETYLSLRNFLGEKDKPLYNEYEKFIGIQTGKGKADKKNEN
jgi:hypothetical protein